VLEIITRYRNGRLITPISADVLARAGVSESLIPRTLQALQTLDLIDKDGAPTQTLEGLRLAPEAEYRDKLADWVRSAYPEIFLLVDPATADGTSIRDAFRGIEPRGQQDRMITLFQGLCVAAGLSPDKPARATPAARQSSSPRPTSPPPLAASTPRARSAVRRPIRDAPKHQWPASTVPALPPSLAGLLTSLPVDGEGWTAERRDKFMAAFGTVLDLCFPIVEEGSAGDDEEAA
jgi:hypothetical protein